MTDPHPIIYLTVGEVIAFHAEIPQFGLTRMGDFARMQAIISRTRLDGITVFSSTQEQCLHFGM